MTRDTTRFNGRNGRCERDPEPGRISLRGARGARRGVGSDDLCKPGFCVVVAVEESEACRGGQAFQAPVAREPVAVGVDEDAVM
jgi:hypothetical protein